MGKSITKELGRKKKLPHRNPRTVSEHTSGNVHRGQLLEQKLGCVRNMHLRNPVLIVTQSTFEQSFLQFSAKVSQNQTHPLCHRAWGKKTGQLTQQESSIHSHRKCGRGTDRRRQINALSGRNSPRGQSCSHAPFPRIAVHRHEHDPPQAVA